TDIRIDTATQTGSVIDVVKLVLGPNVDRTTPQKAYERLEDSLKIRILHVKINGKGRPTPVADAKTLVEIVWALPGKTARDFRRRSAETVCRVLGGDLTLAREIETRHCTLNATEESRRAQDFLLAAEATEVQVTQMQADPRLVLPLGFEYLDDSHKRAIAFDLVSMEMRKRKAE
ncbi:unnamed protein product, partial [Phaeothamnion confervicola]